MELGLTKMNETFTLILIDKTLSNSVSTTLLTNNSSNELVSELMNESVILIVKYIQTCIQTGNTGRRKLLSKENKFKQIPTVEHITNAIENRRQNIVKRAQYSLGKQTKIIFRDN